MQQLTATLSNFALFYEKESRLTQFSLYAASSGLLAYCFIRKLPTKKFIKASDVPNHFIRQEVAQRGVIVKVEGPLLMTNHKPPINLSWSQQTLPIKLFGISIDGNGLSWLGLFATGKEVKFIPLSNAAKDSLACKVILLENQKELDIGKTLISMGFARILPLESDAVKSNKNIESYLKELKTKEFRAKLFRKGQWKEIPENWVAFQLRKKFEASKAQFSEYLNH